MVTQPKRGFSLAEWGLVFDSVSGEAPNRELIVVEPTTGRRELWAEKPDCASSHIVLADTRWEFVRSL